MLSQPLLPMVLGQREGEGTSYVCVHTLVQLPLSVSLTSSSVVKTQSRRQSVLVCSLLVISLLVSAAQGQTGELSGLAPREYLT